MAGRPAMASSSSSKEVAAKHAGGAGAMDKFVHKKRGNPFFGEMNALFAIVRERSPSVNNLIGTKTLQFAGKVSVNSNERRGSRLFELSVTPENHLLQVMREMENKTSVSDITEWLEEAVEIEKVENNKLAVL
jgi:hypothetical protein